jgi:dihydropyrimidine dehydrogenase (NAD+) subunit PreT
VGDTRQCAIPDNEQYPTLSDIGDIAAGRLDAAQLAANFADAHPPLSPAQAVVEANRCYFCYDAPCVAACPTGIDIPSFIRKIATGNVRGSAQTILEANILGGSCARVCPTEELCERACVHTAQEHKPIEIGALQRHATDWLMQRGIAPFQRAAPTGRRIAVVGAGPAGLACAHGLARHGHDVTIFEARPKPGGLNEYGIAAYKVADDYAQREVAFILAIGGISIEYGKALGRDVTLDALRRDFDAVFLGLGQAGVKTLGLDGETLGGVRDAIDFIAELRQAPKAQVAVGRRVVVIGGGNTAIDAATQARRLGAEDVTIVYRRGPEHMTATGEEQAWAQINNVRIRHWAAPARLISGACATTGGPTVTGVEFARTKLDAGGRLILTGEKFVLEADMVLKAIGQSFVPDGFVPDPAAFDRGNGIPALHDGRIMVDAERCTSLSGVYAGGDCVPGADLTVVAVQDGKLAAAAIHRMLGR